MTFLDFLCDPLVGPLESITGVCSIVIYPGEWRIAIPAALMRVDDVTAVEVIQWSHPLCAPLERAFKTAQGCSRKHSNTDTCSSQDCWNECFHTDRWK